MTAIAKDYERATELQAAGDSAQAAAIYEAILTRDPSHLNALQRLAATRLIEERLDEAGQLFERALALGDHAIVHSNYAVLLSKQQRTAEALEHFDRAVLLDPTRADAWLNRGTLLAELGRFEAAIECYGRVLERVPDHAMVQENLARVHLQCGQFELGWKLYEARKQRDLAIWKRQFTAPEWTGREPIAGKRILVHHEQGLGDTIQFSRLIEPLKDRGAEILFAPQPALAALMRHLHPLVAVASLSERQLAYDYRIALLSLPLALGERLDRPSGRAPWLAADPVRVAQWSARLGRAGLRIGICWQGQTGQADVGRSFELARFGPLARHPGVRLISLHKGAGEAQLKSLPPGMAVETLGDDFDAPPGQFLDSAAVIELCDLVISADTSIVHLAGALGRPVWVALKHVPDWRWLMERSDCPWYPTMRLFRQPAPGDWDSVFAEIDRALAQLLTDRAAQTAAAVPQVPISWGELLDKLTILEIKRERIAKPAARDNIMRELAEVARIAGPVLSDPAVAELKAGLHAVNLELWEIEDAIRRKEGGQSFDAEFIELARAVYRRNDRRAEIKRAINQALASAIVEEKSYEAY